MNKASLLSLLLSTIMLSCRPEVQQAPIHTAETLTGELYLSDQQIQLGNIVTDSVSLHELGDEWQLTGTIGINQNTLNSVSSKVMGRIEKLYYKNEGDAIRKGQPIYDLYSEDLSLTANELALTMEKKKTFGAGEPNLDKIIESAAYKLSLYGLVQAQIDAIKSTGNIPDVFTILSPSNGVLTEIIKREGESVMEGETIFHLADFSTLWMEAQVYTDDLFKVENNMQAVVTIPGLEGLKVEGKIDFTSPELNADSKISIVRIQIPNTGGLLKPGMLANAFILRDRKKVLAVPADAVLLGGNGASVWVKSGDNTYAVKMVETGMETNEFTEIKKGIHQGEEVVISGAYLLNSEYIFRMGTSAMAGHSHE